jgi:hypothetical protein
MPIPGAKYRVKTTKTGKKIRLAFVRGKAVEAKPLNGPHAGELHTIGQVGGSMKRG